MMLSMDEIRKKIKPFKGKVFNYYPLEEYKLEWEYDGHNLAISEYNLNDFKRIATTIIYGLEAMNQEDIQNTTDATPDFNPLNPDN